MSLGSLAAYNSTGASSATESKSDESRKKLADDLDSFLNLLTTQLKNQDPMSPMDTTEFTNQLVQFASVEQQIQMNTNLEDIKKIQETGRMSSAVGYIGADVTAKTNAVPLQDGKASFTYTLDKDAKKITLGLFDASGKLVKDFEGKLTAGSHDVTWDGVDRNGKQLADGAYEFRATALDGDSKVIGVSAVVAGKVTGVAADGTDISLALGDVTVPLDDVVTFKAAAAAATAAN